jgi:transposase-like protein
VHHWVAQFKEKAKNRGGAKGSRETVAIDETATKINVKHFYQAALDIERNEVVWMRVYPARNHLTTRNF